MMRFVFVDNETEGGRIWIVEASDKHNAIATAVKNGYSEDMANFYYGFEDGQTSIYTIEKEIPEYDPNYMLNQIERLTWEGHQLRMLLIANGADMDEVREMTNNEAWMAQKKEGS